jgi:type I restriction enzyme R subunit
MSRFHTICVRYVDGADTRRRPILTRYDPRLRNYLDCVLSQFGERGLESDKLPELLQLKYGLPTDAVTALGSVVEIRTTFRGFQGGLYDEAS